MKSIIFIDDKYICVKAFKESTLDEKILQVIREHIFDPEGYIFQYVVIKGHTVKTKEVHFNYLFEEGDLKRILRYYNRYRPITNDEHIL